MAEDDLLVLGRQKIEHAVLDVVEKFVDDSERIDLDAVVTSLTLNAGIVGNVESDDNRLAGGGSLHVGKRDVARAGTDDSERNLLALDLTESLDDRLERTLGIGLDDDVELALAFGGHARHERVERRGLRGRKLLLLALAGGFLGEGARALFVEHDAEFGAGVGNARKTRGLDGSGRRSLLDAAAVIVDESADLAEMLADEERVADLKRTASDEKRRAWTEALLKFGFDDVTVGAARGIRRKLKNFGLNENVLEKLVDAFAGLSGNGAADDVAAPIFRRKALLLELLLYAIDVGGRLVGLGDGDHDLNARLTRDGDTLLGLRHDAVVGRDDQNGDIGKLGAAAAHRAERGVAGSVEERDLLARDLDLVGADLLGYAARFARRDVFLADPVHESRLAVVDVAEERDDGRTGLKSLGSIVRYQIVGVDGLKNGLRSRFVAGVLDGNLKTVLLGDLRGDIGFDALVDRGENLKSHQIGDKTVRLYVEFRGEILYDYGAADGNLARFLVHAYAPARLGNRSGNAGNSLIERALGLAVLAVLAAVAVIIVEINRDRLRRTRLRLSGDGDLDGRSGRRVLERFEAFGGKPDTDGFGSLRRVDGNLRFNAGSHADNRLLGRGRNGNLRSGRGDLYGLGRLRRLDRLRLGFILPDLDGLFGSGRSQAHDLTLRGRLRGSEMGGKAVSVGVDGILTHFARSGALSRADGLDVGASAQIGYSVPQRREIARVDRTDRARNFGAATFGGSENVSARDTRLFG